MPSGFDAAPVSPTASVTTSLSYIWDGSNGHLVNSSTDTASQLYLTERAAAATPPSTKVFCWPDSTDHSGLECKANNSANVFKMILSGVDVNPTTGQVTATHLGSALPLAQGGTALTAVPGSSGNFLYNNSGAIGAKVIAAADIPASDFSTGTSKTFSLSAGYFECTGTCTVTMPVPSAGAQYCVRNSNNVSTVITFAAIGASARYENTASTAYGTAGTGTLVSGGAVGDKVCLVGKDSTHYDIYSFGGTWTVN
jgi:hypothetical protein